MRDAKLAFLKELAGAEGAGDEHATLLTELLSEDPVHLPTLAAAIAGCETIKPKEEEPKAELARLQTLCTYADSLITAVDTSAVAAHGGRRVDDEDIEAKLYGKEMDKQKAALISALKSKSVALGRSLQLAAVVESIDDPLEAVLQERLKATGTYFHT